jgi:hypothetical protein
MLKQKMFGQAAVKVLSSWYEELKVANSAFHNVGWQRQASRSSALSLGLTVVCVEKLMHKI